MRFFSNGLKELLSQNVDITSLKMLLTTSSYSPTYDTDDFRADVTNEVSGTGYTSGGAALSNVAFTIVLDSALTAWATGATIVAGDLRRPSTANGYCYRATNAGTTHASTEPTWPTTVGQTVSDNGIVWECVSADFVVKLDCDDVTWATATITARTAVIYEDTGSSATDKLIAAETFSSDKSSSGADFTVTVPSGGAFHFGGG